MPLEPEPLLASVVDLLPLGVWVVRAPGGELVLANAAFREIMGMPAIADVAAGGYAAPYGIYDREGRPYPEERLPFARALATGEDVTIDDIVIHRRDGRRVNIRATARPIRGAGDAIVHVVVAFADVTAEVEAAAAQRSAEDSRRGAQQLEALGTLAAGVAHDFNNLLAAIQLIASRLTRGERDPARRRELAQIEEVTESAARLTTALLTFGRGRARGVLPVDLGELLQRMIDLVSRTFERGIRVLAARPAEPVVVQGDVGQLEQIIMNLLVNARDAMPDGGELRVQLRVEGGAAVLEVSDSGRGVPAELRARIFEPYFTTKAGLAREGAGLGLATVYSAVEAHHGSVEVRDAVPHGACFRVTLPVVAAAAVASGARAAAALASPPRAGTILVVEDDAVVRAAARRGLQTLGYRVIEAVDGVEALRLAAVGELDAALVDLVMPRLDGRRTLDELRRLRPDLRVVMLSGRWRPEDEADLRARGAAGFLAKPFDLAALGRMLDDLQPNS